MMNNDGDTRRTILLVDDNTEFCELVGCIFGECGFGVVVAATKPKVVRALSQFHPCAAIVDGYLSGDPPGHLARHPENQSSGGREDSDRCKLPHGCRGVYSFGERSRR